MLTKKHRRRQYLEDTRCARVWLSCVTAFNCPVRGWFVVSASAYRIPESEASLPAIPVHPVGYEDAYHFLRWMTAAHSHAGHTKHRKGPQEITQKTAKERSVNKVRTDNKQT